MIHSIAYRPWCARLTHTLGFRIVQLSVVVAYACLCRLNLDCVIVCQLVCVQLTLKGISIGIRASL